MANTTDRTSDEVLGERIRFVAVVMLLIFLGGWSCWFYPFDDLLDRSGTPLGADFAMFYVAGQVVLDGAGDQLYEQAVHQQRLQQLFPAIDERFALPFRYPPFVAVLMAPLAALPYPAAYAAFLGMSCAAWYAAMRLLFRQLSQLQPAWRETLICCIIGWPVVLETLIGGQASMFALLIVTLVYVLLRNQRIVLAGAVLALAAYKPNVLALLALGCLARYPKMWRGFMPVAAGCLLLSLVPDGWRVLSGYCQLTASLALGSWDIATPFWKVHGLAPWITLLLPEGGRACGWLLGSVAAAGLAVWYRRSHAGNNCPEPIWFATLISVNVLFNPYTPIYDLVLLMIGVLLTAEHLAARHGPSIGKHLVAAQILIATVYFGPHLSQVIAKVTGAQPFALALAAIAAWQLWLVIEDQKIARSVPSQLPTGVPG
jgi:hypothetical protein